MSLIRASARWSNYLIFLAGMIVTVVGLRIALVEHNLLCFLVLLIGVLTMLTAYFGIWLAKQPQGRPCCLSLYSALLLLLVLPQLVGAMVVTRPSFVDSLVSQSCSKFQHAVLVHTMGTSMNHTAAACADQLTCSLSDDCVCDCDEKCRSCLQDVSKSREFVQSHATMCSYLFIGFGLLELFAWVSMQMLSRFETQPLALTNETELQERRRPSAAESNQLLKDMKAKYGDKSGSKLDDPLAGSSLLSSDQDHDIFCV